ncbi:hypothetical protein FGE12_23670 [Aggregicoccus sp. 17bor-14]|uniref:hypothetical protein n=1 Tax=Myxococcaceae TaxID=31 RepID=UPI00129CFD2E|nr:MULTISPECIES: hypothetical protein [Myxococcaceae]MBF5045425.1 hypothetical protein [Simulacricoccus sp. 17bor-14]MRI91166.1 hypothetical protein [Aggregicoccus sp. 17bor-14]
MLFVGYGLFLPGSAHWRADLPGVGLILSAGQCLGVYLVDRGHRTARVALVAVLTLWALDLLGGVHAVWRHNQGEDVRRFNRPGRGALILGLSVLLGLALHPLVPPIAPAEVRERLAALALQLATRHSAEDACDPRREKCLTPPAPVWQDDGRW